jgi:hypothetical protein
LRAAAGDESVAEPYSEILVPLREGTVAVVTLPAASKVGAPRGGAEVGVRVVVERRRHIGHFRRQVQLVVVQDVDADESDRCLLHQPVHTDSHLVVGAEGMVGRCINVDTRAAVGDVHVQLHVKRAGTVGGCTFITSCQLWQAD